MSGAGRRTQRPRESTSPYARSILARTSRSYGKWPFAIDFWVGLPYLVVASIADGPGASVVNTTHFNDPAFNKLYGQASKTLDKNKRASIVHAMQKIQYDRGGYIIWSFQNSRRRLLEEGRRHPADRQDRLGAQPLPAAQAVLHVDTRGAGDCGPVAGWTSSC